MKHFIRDKLPILEIYVLRKIFLPSMVVALVLLGALSLERVLRLVEQVTSYGVPAIEVARLIVYLIPHYLSLAVPAGFFVGAMLGIRSLHEQSELVVMRTFGMSMRRMLRPILSLAVGLTAVMLLVTCFAQPYAQYLFRQKFNALISKNILTNLEPGVFKRIGEHIIIRVNEIHPDGMTYEGFFMAREYDTDIPSRAYLTAQMAVRIGDDQVDSEVAAELLLTNCVFIDEHDEPGGKTITRQVEFDQFPLLIPRENSVEAFGPRGWDGSELTMPELLTGGVPGKPAHATPAELITELNNRLVKAFSLPILGILAVPLALLGQGRGARARGLGVGFVLFLVYEKLTGVAEIMSARNEIHALGLWLPLVGLALLALWLFYRFSGDRGRSILLNLTVFAKLKAAMGGGAGCGDKIQAIKGGAKKQ